MDKVLHAYKKGYRCTKDGIVLNPKGVEVGHIGPNGYITVSIRILGKTKRVSAHRIQAFQKYGYKLFEKGIIVRHLNGSRLNFSWENIVIGSHSDNYYDIPIEERKLSKDKASEKMKKYNYEEVRTYHYGGKASYLDTMEKFNISSTGTLHYILNRIR